jgi:hypothetical protein
MAVSEDLLLGAKELIARHEEWKLTFWAAVFSRKPLTVQQLEQVVHGDRCPIGRWLEAQADTELAASVEFQEVVSNHNDFHLEMMEVASLLARKDYGAAARAIQEGSTFAASGRRLALSILALNRVCRILAEP